jgi:hypothetical protein
LLLVLATALADPDDAERCDPSTGLPPDLAAMDDARLLASDGVAAALLAIVKARGEAVVVGEGDEDEDEDDGGPEARGTAAAAARGGDSGPSGVVGLEAAAVLRAQERRVCRRVFDATVAWLRRALEGGDEGEGGKKGKDANVPKGSARKAGKAKTSGPVQDTPYGSVTYLPRVAR